MWGWDRIDSMNDEILTSYPHEDPDWYAHWSLRGRSGRHKDAKVHYPHLQFTSLEFNYFALIHIYCECDKHTSILFTHFN